MRNVLDSDQIAHVWAHSRQEHGRSPSAMSFSGSVLHSYRTWIGERLAPGLYVLNDTHYSVSTSRHQHRARMAVPGGATVFRVNGVPTGTNSFSGGDNLKNTGRKLFRFYVEESARVQADAEKARQPKKDRLLGQSVDLLNEAQRVSTAFKLRLKVDRKAVARLAAAKARQEKRMAADAEERRRKVEEDSQRKLSAWLGGDGDAWLNATFPDSFLRLDPDNPSLVQTSRGIVIPVETAKDVLGFIRANREKGWRANGHKFHVKDAKGSEWTIDSVSEHGIVAGCHRIGWKELDRFGAVLDALPVLA